MDKWFITSKKAPENRLTFIYIVSCNLGACRQPALAVFLSAVNQTYVIAHSSGFCVDLL